MLSVVEDVVARILADAVDLDFVVQVGAGAAAGVADGTDYITAIDVIRDACCGCARYVAEKLVGVSADEAEFQAGLAHHHYPCLASMVKDPEFHDTLMYVSGHLLKDNVSEQVRPFKRVQMIRPVGRVE